VKIAHFVILFWGFFSNKEQNDCFTMMLVQISDEPIEEKRIYRPDEFGSALPADLSAATDI
jgi:hypothetical protein